jgi:hypothetical protein
LTERLRLLARAIGLPAFIATTFVTFRIGWIVTAVVSRGM